MPCINPRGFGCVGIRDGADYAEDGKVGFCAFAVGAPDMAS